MKKCEFLFIVFLSAFCSLCAAETLLDLLGTERVDSSGAPVKNQKITGVYFSAQWCPPCQKFTPKLVEVYNQAQKQGIDFDVVLVSSDESEGDMLASMEESNVPWLALPFSSEESEQAKTFKSEVLETNSIPVLVVLNAAGEVITKNGCDDIEEFGLQALYKWRSQKPETVEIEGETVADDTSEKLPPPEKDEITMTELITRLVEFDGKVVETEITFAASLVQLNDGRFCTFCFFDKSTSSDTGSEVLIPEEGKEFFEELNEKGFFASPQTVYFLVHAKKPARAKSGSRSRSFQLEAVGERYRKGKDEYCW